MRELRELLRIRAAADALIEDVHGRYPGEELRCPKMRGLELALCMNAPEVAQVAHAKLADDALRYYQMIGYSYVELKNYGFTPGWAEFECLNLPPGYYCGFSQHNERIEVGLFHKFTESVPGRDAIDAMVFDVSGYLASTLDDGIVMIERNNDWHATLSVDDHQIGYFIRTPADRDGFVYGTGLLEPNLTKALNHD